MNKKILIVGLIASIAMAMIEMVYEGFFGAGFWSAPVFIAATVLRDLQSVVLPVVFSAVPVLIGLIGHMMNSVILGLLFVMLFKGRATTRVASIGYGIGYALAIFFLMWFFVLPLIDPVMLVLSPYIFALSHVVWGAVLGAMVFETMTKSTVSRA